MLMKKREEMEERVKPLKGSGQKGRISEPVTGSSVSLLESSVFREKEIIFLHLQMLLFG